MTEHLVDQAQQQLNVRLHWTKIAMLKRLAAKRGVAVNAFLDSVIEDLMAAEAASLRQQITEEQDEVRRTQDALIAALNDAETGANGSDRTVKR